MSIINKIAQWIWPPTPILDFTENAQRCLALSRRAAVSCRTSAVDDMHVLVGILWLRDCSAVAVLKEAGVGADILLERLKKVIPMGAAEISAESLFYTDEVKKILAYSMREAGSVGATRVGTDHIVLGILRLGQGKADEVMRDLGLELHRFRLLVQKRENEAEKKPHQALVPTTTSVTPPAAQEPRQP